jgi:hypothetical protein
MVCDSCFLLETHTSHMSYNVSLQSFVTVFDTQKGMAGTPSILGFSVMPQCTRDAVRSLPPHTGYSFSPLLPSRADSREY